MTYAQIMGRENVIAGTDCGYGNRVYPDIGWAKMRAGRRCRVGESTALAERQLSSAKPLRSPEGDESEDAAHHRQEDHMQTPGAVGQDPGTPQKGPRVWLDMDQAALDAAYTQSVWAPNREQLVARHRRNSDCAYVPGCATTLCLCAPPIEALDVYRTTPSAR